MMVAVAVGHLVRGDGCRGFFLFQKSRPGFCGSDRLFSMSPPTGMGKMLENGVLRFLDSKSTVEDGYHTHLPEDTTCL